MTDTSVDSTSPDPQTPIDTVSRLEFGNLSSRRRAESKAQWEAANESTLAQLSGQIASSLRRGSMSVSLAGPYEKEIDYIAKQYCIEGWSVRVEHILTERQEHIVSFFESGLPQRQDEPWWLFWRKSVKKKVVDFRPVYSGAPV